MRLFNRIAPTYLNNDTGLHKKPCATGRVKSAYVVGRRLGPGRRKQAEKGAMCTELPARLAVVVRLVISF